MDVIFKHEKSTHMEALGINMEYFATKLSNVVSDYMTDDALDKTSHLSEKMHTDMPYSHILYLATKQVVDTLQDFKKQQMSELIKKEMERSGLSKKDMEGLNGLMNDLLNDM
jgi:hypothetical protein